MANGNTSCNEMSMHLILLFINKPMKLKVFAYYDGLTGFFNFSFSSVL